MDTNLPATLRFSSVVLASPDPPALADFYRRLLDLEIADAGDSGVSLALGARAHLSIVHGKAPTNPYAAGLFHVAYRYPTRAALARAFRRLIETGISVQGASDHDVSEALYVADPEGNGIELTWDRPREQWRYREGRLVMGTRRLDLRGLLEAASSANAEDPPVVQEPPIIGHVHFRVTDLEEAERFWIEEVGLDLVLRYGEAASFLSRGGYHHHVGVNRFAPWVDPEGVPAGIRKAEIELTPRLPDSRLPAFRRLMSPEGIEIVVR